MDFKKDSLNMEEDLHSDTEASTETSESYIERIKAFYFDISKMKRNKRLIIMAFELFLLYPVGTVVIFFSPNQLLYSKDYSVFNCIVHVFSLTGIFLYIIVNLLLYIFMRNNKNNEAETYTISQKGTYGTAKHLNGTEDEKEILKRIPNDPTIIMKEEGNILGYDSKTDEVIMKDVSGNSNRNIAICGGPGTGKSRTLVRNLIFQCVRRMESMFLTDPKGEIAESMAKYLRKKGYIVKFYNLKNFNASDSFDCLAGLNNEEGYAFINVLADIIMKNTESMAGKGGNANAALNLLIALMLFIVIEMPEGHKNMVELYNLITLADAKTLDAIFAGLDATHPAKAPYNVYAGSSENFRSNITTDVATRLLVYAQKGVQSISTEDEIDLTLPGKKPCAYFIITPDQNSAYDFMASLFQAVAYNKLVKYADDEAPGGILPVKVQMLLDEFPNIGEIPDFGRKISTVRSRGIATTLIFQTIGQMQNRYPDGSWEEILAACDTSVFLGCNDETTAEYYSRKTGIATIEVGTQQKNMKTIRITDFTPEIRQSDGDGRRYLYNPDELQAFKYPEELIFCKGYQVFNCQKFDFEDHPEANELEYEKAILHVPEWRKKEEGYKLFVEQYIPGTESFNRNHMAGAGSSAVSFSGASTGGFSMPNKPRKPKNSKSKRNPWSDIMEKNMEKPQQVQFDFADKTSTIIPEGETQELQKTNQKISDTPSEDEPEVDFGNDPFNFDIL